MDPSALKYVIPRLNVNANNQVKKLIPDYTVFYWSSNYGILRINPTYTSTFVVDLSTATAIYNDTVNNRVDVYGQINTYSNVDFYYFVFVVDPSIAVDYPGLEYTVHFKNLLKNNCFVGVYPNETLTAYSGDPDFLSPGGAFDSNFETVSITLKSDGVKFIVVSSGPVSWSTCYDR